ncbi:hypothetical protein [Methylobacterium fujisawaense]
MSEGLNTPLLRVLSLGLGVQSTTLALMAAHGEVGPMPDCAIVADTGWEGPKFYEQLRWLSSGNVLPFPVHIVSGGNLRADLIRRGSVRAGRFVTVPFFLRRTTAAGTEVPVYEGGNEGLFDEDEEAEAKVVGYRTLTQDEVRDGIGRRQCTSHYKIEPIQRKVRELLGYGPRDAVPAGAVEQWIGISQDEVIRATPSKVRYVTKRFPLLEKRMRRGDCLNWLDRNGYPRPPQVVLRRLPAPRRGALARDHGGPGASGRRRRGRSGDPRGCLPRRPPRDAVPAVHAPTARANRARGLLATCSRLAGRPLRPRVRGDVRGMTQRSEPTFTATIHMAGDLRTATETCRRFCMEGLCVTIEPSTFVYTGGAEEGFRIGLLNYPRFPAEPTKILQTAFRLADALRLACCQHSWLIVTPDETIWNSTREAT